MRRLVPFGLHQGFEYLLAVLLAGTAAHVHGSMATASWVAAGFIACLAALTNGRLGIAHVVGRRVHTIGDLVVAAGLAVSPVLARPDLDVNGVIAVEAAAVVILWLALSTRYTRYTGYTRHTRHSELQASPPPEPSKQPVPSMAWTLGILASRARHSSRGMNLARGARRLGGVVGRASGRGRGYSKPEGPPSPT